MFANNRNTNGAFLVSLLIPLATTEMSRGTAQDQLQLDQLTYTAGRKREEQCVLQWTLPEVFDYATRDMQDLLQHLIKTFPEHVTDEDHAANILQVALDARLTVHDKNLRYTAMRNLACDKLEQLIKRSEEQAAKCQARVELGKRKKAERAQAKLAAVGITDPDAEVVCELEEPAAKRPTPVPAISLADTSSATVREQMPGLPPLALSPPTDERESVEEQLLMG